MPKSYFQQGAMTHQDTKPSRMMSTRKYRKSKVKSEEFVTNDFDDSEGEKQEAKLRRSPRSNKTATSQSKMQSTLREAEEEQVHDDEDVQMQDANELVQMQNANDPETHSTTENSTTSPTSASDRDSLLPSTRGTSWSTTSTTTPPPLTASIDNIDTSKPYTKNPSKPTYKFPSIPPLEARKRAPFHLGATIALENIREDHEVRITLRAPPQPLTSNSIPYSPLLSHSDSLAQYSPLPPPHSLCLANTNTAQPNRHPPNPHPRTRRQQAHRRRLGAQDGPGWRELGVRCTEGVYEGEG